MEARIDRYSYSELLQKVDNDPTDENIENLAKWFLVYGMCYWNGECFAIDRKRDLSPIYGEEDEDGNVSYIGWKIRQ